MKTRTPLLEEGDRGCCGSQRSVTELKAGVGTFRNDVLPSLHYNCSGTRTNVYRRVASLVADTVSAYGQRLRP
jgi:hypothetical protein